MILVLDHDREARRLLREFLGGRGHDILCVADISDAMEVMRSARPALLILDWHRTKTDALAVLGAIRADPCMAETPVVIYCEWLEWSSVQAALAAGAHCCLTKGGLNLDELRRAADRFDRRGVAAATAA